MIETRTLTRVFKHNKLAVDGVDLSIDTGAMYGLTGPNGAGGDPLYAAGSDGGFCTRRPLRMRAWHDDREKRVAERKGHQASIFLVQRAMVVLASAT